ncbi:hypothetical protein C2W64_01930 [Brevibacillus laterosporus]|nr:hypothetical protein C2W64_01930 [Brevibacillus laterosporus]
MVLSDQFTTLSSNKVAENWLTLLQKWERIDSSTLPNRFEQSVPERCQKQ